MLTLALTDMILKPIAPSIKLLFPINAGGLLLDIQVYWNILTMHVPMNVKSPNNTSKWQMRFNLAFKGLIRANH
jgi:hypothetical protein